MPSLIPFIAGISMAGILLSPAASLPDVPPVSADTAAVANAQTDDADTPVPSVPTHAQVETEVRAYFKNTPILAEVARCESHFLQSNTDGSVHYGRENHDGTHDIGVMQINEIWQDQADKLGDDLTTLKGNMAFAKWLYEKQGLQPWMSSSLCWARAPQVADDQ